MTAVGRAVAAGLLLLALTTPGAAQRRDRAEAEALLLFLESIAAQRTARQCERGIPGYRERFDDVFARWSSRHRSRVERGEAVFHQAAAEKDRPYLDHAKMEGREGDRGAQGAPARPQPARDHRRHAHGVRARHRRSGRGTRALAPLTLPSAPRGEGEVTGRW